MGWRATGAVLGGRAARVDAERCCVFSRDSRIRAQDRSAERRSGWRAAVSSTCTEQLVAAALERYSVDQLFDRFVAEAGVDRKPKYPAGLDPESDEEERYYAHLPFDAYARPGRGRVFAVSSEAFFVDPSRSSATTFPEWYELLCEFFLQDPLADR